MHHWIFQGNPDHFDIDTYLSRTSEISWSVRQKSLAPDMAVGDEIFLWRAAGIKKAISGIIAYGFITNSPSEMPDDQASQGLWRNGSGPGVALRVRISLRVKMGANEVVRREWLKDDPVVSGLRILKMSSETNYQISSDEADRLREFMSRYLGKADDKGRHPKAYKDFGEAPNDDPNELQMFAAKVRKGQPKFRNKLLRIYGGQCAISGHGPDLVLEAVHIIPHAHSGINKRENGILLRADLHYLFDAGQLKIDPSTMRVVVNVSLKDTPYWLLNEQRIRRGEDGSDPSPEYLKKRWQDG